MALKALILFFFCTGPPGPPGASVSNMPADFHTSVVVKNLRIILQEISGKSY